MKIFLLFISLILFLGCSEPKEEFSESQVTRTEKQHYHTGVLASEASYNANNQYHGNRKIYHKNGNLKRSEKYINGLPDGEQKSYFESGELSEIIPYENGIRSGLEKHFRRNGNESWSQNWKNNRLEGKAQRFYKNGQIERETIYLKGIRQSQISYNENGDLNEEFIYENGLCSRHYIYAFNGKKQRIKDCKGDPEKPMFETSKKTLSKEEGNKACLSIKSLAEKKKLQSYFVTVNHNPTNKYNKVSEGEYRIRFEDRIFLINSEKYKVDNLINISWMKSEQETFQLCSLDKPTTEFGIWENVSPELCEAIFNKEIQPIVFDTNFDMIETNSLAKKSGAHRYQGSYVIGKKLIDIDNNGEIDNLVKFEYVQKGSVLRWINVLTPEFSKQTMSPLNNIYTWPKDVFKFNDEYYIQMYSGEKPSVVIQIKNGAKQVICGFGEKRIINVKRYY